MTRFHAPGKKYAGYIFDCDGTLADTMPIHFEAWKKALAEGGAQFEFTWDLFNQRAGMGMEETVRELSMQFQQSLDADEIAHAQRDLYRQMQHSVQPIEAVCHFARQVSQFAPVSVASGSLRPHVVQTLELIGLGDLFKIIVTPEDVVTGKPAPDLFLLAATKMGTAPTETLVLEDAEFGFLAARKAQMDYVKVGPPTISSSPRA